MSLDDWDALFRAVQTRLRLTVSDAQTQHLNGAAAPLQTGVLECVDALDQLHAMLHTPWRSGRAARPLTRCSGLLDDQPVQKARHCQHGKDEEQDLAMPTALAVLPPKPNTAAIRAVMKKTTAPCGSISAVRHGTATRTPPMTAPEREN